MDADVVAAGLGDAERLGVALCQGGCDDVVVVVDPDVVRTSRGHDLLHDSRWIRGGAELHAELLGVFIGPERVHGELIRCVCIVKFNVGEEQPVVTVVFAGVAILEYRHVELAAEVADCKGNGAVVVVCIDDCEEAGVALQRFEHCRQRYRVAVADRVRGCAGRCPAVEYSLDCSFVRGEVLTLGKMCGNLGALDALGYGLAVEIDIVGLLLGVDVAAVDTLGYGSPFHLLFSQSHAVGSAGFVVADIEECGAETSAQRAEADFENE